MRSEVDDALQSTTEMLSQVTRLLALVSAPGLETASVRHVEVLLLQPSVVMVVTITSTGGVAKKLITFDRAVDPGLAAWANEYLNERLAGVGIGTHILRKRIDDPGLAGREKEFVDALRPAFADLAAPTAQSLYVGGAASLLDGVRPAELEACRRLLSVLEKRAAVLELMTESFDVRRPVRPRRARSPRPPRRRPRRRDLRPADAHARLGRPARPGPDGLRQGRPHGPRRRLRALPARRARVRGGLTSPVRLGAWPRPNATTTSCSGVERTATDAEIKKAFRKLARELHPDVNGDADAQERFRAVAEAYEVLSDAERREALRPVRPRRSPPRRLRARATSPSRT